MVYLLNTQDLIIGGVGALLGVKGDVKQIEQEMREHKAVLDGANGGVQLVAGLIWRWDPKLGRQFAAVGSGTVLWMRSSRLEGVCGQGGDGGHLQPDEH